MSRIRFNPRDWLPAPSKETARKDLPAPIYNKEQNSSDDIERITREIEQRGVDIAPSYQEWCDLGFALAEGLGENGRSYYHRLSRLHPDYDRDKTDKQYTACLNGHGQGITIRTFFHMAKEAGVSVGGDYNPSFLNHNGGNEEWRKGGNDALKRISHTSTIPQKLHSAKEDENVRNSTELPSLPDEVYEHLPSFLNDCVNNTVLADDRDTILLGTLTCISACFHNVRGVYDGNPVFSNFYLFVVAAAGMGKGALTLCGEIVRPIHRELREIYNRQMEEYKEAVASSNKSKGENREQPKEPPSRMLIIPANSSASAFLKILSDNDGQGLLFETEGDTLSQTLRSDYGNYSDVLRKAFHHEPVSQSRRKDNEYIDVNEPCLSVVLSGTPRQVQRLIPDAENGLLSRFCFYNIPFSKSIRNVFSIRDLTLSKKAIFRQLGECFKRERAAFMRRGEFTFSLLPLLETPFTDWLCERNDECCDEIDIGMQGVIRRIGLVAFRIMMLLTIVREFGNYTAKESRLPDGTIPLVCHDDDFRTAISIADTLIEHAKSVYCTLADPNTKDEIRQKENKAAARRNCFFNLLPDKFTKAEYEKMAADNNKKHSTAEKWIDIFIRDGKLQRTSQGNYAKVPQQETRHEQLRTI